MQIIYVCKKVGDKVENGETLAIFYGNDKAKVDAAMAEAQKAFEIGAEPVEPPELIKEIIGL